MKNKNQDQLPPTWVQHGFLTLLAVLFFAIIMLKMHMKP